MCSYVQNKYPKSERFKVWTIVYSYVREIKYINYFECFAKTQADNIDGFSLFELVLIDGT